MTGGITLPRPSDTLWHAWLNMLVRAFQLRPLINRFINEDPTLHYLELLREEWQLLNDTLNFLLPFKEACKDCKGDNVTLEFVQTSIDILSNHFDKARAKHANNESLMTAINTAWFVFDKYYIKLDESPLNVALILLHPSHRKQYLTEF